MRRLFAFVCELRYQRKCKGTQRSPPFSWRALSDEVIFCLNGPMRASAETRRFQGSPFQEGLPSRRHPEQPSAERTRPETALKSPVFATILYFRIPSSPRSNRALPVTPPTAPTLELASKDLIQVRACYEAMKPPKNGCRLAIDERARRQPQGYRDRLPSISP